VFAGSTETHRSAILADRDTLGTDGWEEPAAPFDARLNGWLPKVSLPDESAIMSKATVGNELREDTPPSAPVSSLIGDPTGSNSPDKGHGTFAGEADLRAVAANEIVGMSKFTDAFDTAVDEGEPIQSQRIVNSTPTDPLESSPRSIETDLVALQSTLEEFQLFLIRQGDRLLERRDVAGARL